MKKLEGIYVVMMTPYKNGLIDEDAVRHLVDHFVEEGVQGLVTLGSNGEFPYLSDEEKRKLIDLTVSQAGGRVQVIAGTGCMGTDQTVALTKYANDAGVNAVMVALPIYYQVGFEDVKRHYKRVSEEGGLPIIYYNFPEATRLKLSPAEIAELTGVGQIIGAKETIPDIDEMFELVRLMDGKRFSVLSGTVFNLAAVMDSGICGAIGVLPNLIPRQSVEFYTALRNGDEERKSELMALLFKFMPLMTASAAPHAMVKEALRQLGHPMEPTVKDPLPQLSDEQREIVTRTIEDVTTGL